MVETRRRATEFLRFWSGKLSVVALIVTVMMQQKPSHSHSSDSQWPSRLGRWGAYLVFLCAVTGAAVELIGRQIWVSDGEQLYLRKYELFSFDPELNYTLRPGFTIEGSENRLYPGVGLRINKLGLRSPAVDKRPAIVMVGDSVVFGYGVREEQTMARRLESLLDGKFQVINAGIPGYNYEQVQAMAERLESRIRPVTIVVFVNANDLQPRYYVSHGGATVSRFRAYPWEPNLQEERPVTRSPHDHWILPAILNQYLTFEFPRSAEREESSTDNLLKAEDQIVAYQHSGHEALEKRFRNAISSTQEFTRRMATRGAKVIYVFFPWRTTVVNTTQEDKVMSKWMASIPYGPSTSFVDLLPILRQLESKQSQFLVADNHPNSQGHATIAELVVDELRKLGVSSKQRIE